ncbi:MerR family transcriptional regulator [Geothrix sp. 21YS21S-4]|uniref:MerR family transcriptional regulator n=1 Tax=Geothrix sp. 21YS21S-4 TaxID=3068889 RepID=UPI0027BA9290|nr:MerR family transcriptional regulator [Geothrix sp. 21YS21S-4]
MPTISALARRFGLSRSALLYYDRIGLLRPGSRSAKDYRRYGEAEEVRLERICAYRRAGVPLAEIRRLLDGPERAVAGILEGRLRTLDEEIRRLRGQQRVIGGFLRNPDLLGEPALDKATWVALLRASGFTDADMDRWHATFEAADPLRHQRFLAFLGLSEEEIARIRAASAGPLSGEASGRPTVPPDGGGSASPPSSPAGS